jgi:hypothetical protein
MAAEKGPDAKSFHYRSVANSPLQKKSWSPASILVSAKSSSCY